MRGSVLELPAPWRLRRKRYLLFTTCTSLPKGRSHPENEHTVYIWWTPRVAMGKLPPLSTYDFWPLHFRSGVLDCRRYRFWPLSLFYKMYVGLESLSWTGARIQFPNNEMRHFEKIIIDTFADKSSFGLLTFNLPLQDHILEDLCRVGRLAVLPASLFEHNNGHIRTSYCRGSRPTKTTMKNSVKDH